ESFLEKKMHRRSLLPFLLRRLGIYALTIFGSFTVAFLFFHMIPGDPLTTVLTNLRQRTSYAPPESKAMVDAYEEEFGLKGSLPEQYVRYLNNVFIHQDLGPSVSAFPT